MHRKGEIMKCKACVWWTPKNRDRTIGECHHEKFVYHYGFGESSCPKDGLAYWDQECYNAGFETGVEFGCIHFEKVEGDE